MQYYLCIISTLGTRCYLRAAFADVTMNGMLRMVVEEVDEGDIASGPFTSSDIMSRHPHAPSHAVYTYVSMFSKIRTQGAELRQFI